MRNITKFNSDFPENTQFNDLETENPGCVLVIEDERLEGILTERDIVRLALQELDLAQVPVATVMTCSVISMPLEDMTDLFVVYNVMRRNQIRHLPIVDQQGKVQGIVTLSSLRRNLKKSYFLRFRQVEEVMTAQVITVLPTDSVLAAVQRLATYSISCVVVVQPQVPPLQSSILAGNSTQRSLQIPIGILTERDILQFKALGLNLETIPVQDLMSAPLTCVHPKDSLDMVQELMRQMRVRRLVVTTSEGNLAGIITETNMTKVLDPLEIYGIVEILQMQVSNLTETRDHLLSSRNFDLETGFQREEFRLVYQPQLHLETQTIAGVEALVRWQSQEQGAVSPLEFVPWAEKTYFIVKLGYWILETACRQAKLWQTTGLGKFTVAVNVSSKQIMEPDFVDRTVEILQRTGLDPQFLKLELTESVLVDNLAVAAEQFQRLQAASIQIAIDDFGTGYASLSYLQYFSFDILKIDRSFIQNIDQNLKNKAIVSSIVRLARQLNFQVIAEGVETEQEQDFLLSLGCHYIQGYLFSPPLEVENFSQFVTARPAHH